MTKDRMSTPTRIVVWAGCGLLGIIVAAAMVGNLPPEQRAMIPTALAMATLCVVYAAIAVAVVWLYILPSWLARRSGHRNLAALTAANILLGWTFVGWCLCLVWSLMKTQQPPRV